MTILRHTITGSLVCPKSGDQSPWPAAETEDISSHPVISRQLRRLWLNDKNGFCELTNSPFTAGQLADADFAASLS